MKPLAIISLIALAAIGIGLFQHSRLAELKQESVKLAREIPGSAGGKPVRHPRPRPVEPEEIPSDESLADLEALMVGIFEKVAGAMAGQPMTVVEKAAVVESRERLMQAFAALDPASILKLIERLQSNPDLPLGFREKSVQACVEILMDVNPKALLDVIPSLKDYPEPEGMMNNALRRWLGTNPGPALKWFDDELEKGNPVTRSGGILFNVILEESRLDPSRALTRALSQEAAGNPDSIRNLGANIAMRLDGEDENLAFFSALRRESEKSPGSEVLARIRDTFVDGLGDRLYQWPFESAVALIDAEFTPAEKAAMAKKLSNRGDLDEPGLWATWLLGASLPADGKHPLREFISVWCQIDPAAAGKWLDQAPPGELKSQLVKKHAARISALNEARVKRPDGESNETSGVSPSGSEHDSAQ